MRGWSLIQWIIAIIVIGGAVAIMYIALNAMGIAVPPWVISIAWVVAIVIVAIAAIGVLAAVWRSWFPPGGGPPTP